MKRVRGQSEEALNEQRALTSKIGHRGESRLKKALNVQEMTVFRVLEVRQLGIRRIGGRAYRIS